MLTDQGKEFLRSFEELCTKALIDHRTTSREHREVDGLAESGSNSDARIAQVWIIGRQSWRLLSRIALDSDGLSLQMR